MKGNICTILYGLSGALKGSTIQSLYSSEFKVYSDTKKFFSIDEKYFNWSSRPNDAHLAAFRLMTLDLPGFLPENQDIIIERGITDNLFCIPNRNIPGLESYDDIKIDELVKLEEDIIKRRTKESKIVKKLLIMEDEDFIVKKSLTNKYRLAIYPNLNVYLKKQEEYVDFTMAYNEIDQIIRISNARDYIENFLNINYDE